MSPRRRKIGWVALAGLACGAGVWALSVPFTGLREPFDSSGAYYVVAIFVAGVVAALPAPRYWWVAVIGIFFGERLYAVVMLPETRDWLLFGIIVNLAILTWLPALFGALGTYLVDRYLVAAWRRRNDRTGGGMEN